MIDLEGFGLHAAVMLAGFAGGLCYVALQPGRPSIWGVFSGLSVATLTANYLCQVAAKYLGTPELPAAFVMGLTATWVCRALMRRAQDEGRKYGLGRVDFVGMTGTPQTLRHQIARFA